MKILDIDDVFIFIVKLNYPGFVPVDVIPMSIPILFPHGVAAPLAPLAGPEAWWSSARWACNVDVVCHAGTGVRCH